MLNRHRHCVTAPTGKGRADRHARRSAAVGLLAFLMLAAFGLVLGDAHAARERRPAHPAEPTKQAPAAEKPAPAAPVEPPAERSKPPPDAGKGTNADTAPKSTEAAPAAAAPSESVEADVSTRSVAVTSAFRGSEVIVFGTVLNSRQESAESGLYDIVIVVEGSPTPVIVRRKSNVGGIWLNTSSLKFDRAPSYYAVVSTRPLDEVAEESVLAQQFVGFKRIRFEGALGASATLSATQRDEFREAIVRLKQKEGLYFTEDYGVTFIGKALFRSTVTLPANVKVGPVAVHVLLFHDGVLLSRMTSRVVLARQGVEHYIFAYAFGNPLLYGIGAVAIAVSVGMLASLLVRRIG